MRFYDEKQDEDHKDGEDAAAQDHSDTKSHADGETADHAYEASGTILHSDPTPEQANDFFMDMGHLFHHVQDSYEIEVPRFMVDTAGKEAATVAIPDVLPGPARFSKFMLNELIVGLILVALFMWLGKKMKSGDRPKGRIWNLLETFVVFIRDEIAKPTIGDHDYKKFMPFLLTLFFFVLGLNLLGMVPFMGSATGSLAVTAVLAFCTICVSAGSGMKKMGVVGFLKAQVPHMELPFNLGYALIPLMFVIEIFGFLVKHGVLAIRLFANMFAGHLVLAIFLAFIGVTSVSAWFYLVAPIAVLASVAFSVLELFVAFLQAYVFTFLASLFIGSAQHAH